MHPTGAVEKHIDIAVRICRCSQCNVVKHIESKCFVAVRDFRKLSSQAVECLRIAIRRDYARPFGCKGQRRRAANSGGGGGEKRNLSVPSDSSDLLRRRTGCSCPTLGQQEFSSAKNICICKNVRATCRKSAMAFGGGAIRGIAWDHRRCWGPFDTSIRTLSRADGRGGPAGTGAVSIASATAIWRISSANTIW